MEKSFLVTLAENTRLESERLILRPITLVDAESMYEYSKDDQTTKYVTFIAHESLEVTKYSIASFFMANPLGKFGIELKTTGKFIGAVELRVNGEVENAELGYILNGAYHGQGYMTEAVEKLIEFAFNELKLNAVYARYDVRNQASGNVMKRAGMNFDGVLRQAEKTKGEIIDLGYYSLL